MNFEQFLQIIKARSKIIVLTLACTLLTTVAVSLLLPKTYKATATVVLNYKGVDAVTGQTAPAAMMPGYVATQVDIINSLSVAMQVVDRLKLADNPDVKQSFIHETEGKGDIKAWLARLLQKNLNVVPSRESSVLDITFMNPSPEFAALVANAYAAEYQQTTIRLKVDPLRKASVFFNEQIKTLRDNLEAAQGRLSKYQQDKGIFSVDNRLDVESARLNDLSTQLVGVQGQKAEAQSRQHQIKNGGANESPDIVSNPLIQNLKAQLTQAQAKFADVAQNLGENHPQYKGLKAEVDELRSEINAHIRLTSNSVTGSARILQQREAEVSAALQEQKNRVLELNRARDELTVLSREVESAQRAYESSVNRFNQTSLEGQSNQADVSVLTPALPPVDPASPRILLNILLSLFFGSFLGLVLATLAEFVDRRIRSDNDLAQASAVPVLGVLTDPVDTGSKWKSIFRNRAAVAKIA